MRPGGWEVDPGRADRKGKGQEVGRAVASRGSAEKGKGQEVGRAVASRGSAEKTGTAGRDWGAGTGGHVLVGTGMGGSQS